jgi:hypothetical protein
LQRIKRAASQRIERAALPRIERGGKVEVVAEEEGSG